ncbi:MAG TPA: YifB family Mg chelatase-like AAA ATPase [Mycobacteriales bacterium]|jgi:magnesium chelatase family protein|nr:YifB family Mg chelatase-like AAA ATPase [Mycobacteriales bacterium]
MGLARTQSVALTGLDAHVVAVEADIAPGLPAVAWTGLPDTAVRQSSERVKAAVNNSGETWPSSRRITVGLSPASVRKSGSGFDLAVAVAVLAAAEALDREAVRDLVLIGELGLDGRVQPVTGVLPAVIGAVRHGADRVVVPRGNAREARLVPGLQVTAVGSLAELCAVLRGEWVDVAEPDEPEPAVARPEPDMADVVGQEPARFAVEVAAAGGHHLYLQGPPGVGKTMLAERLPGLLPDLDEQSALEVTSIHSLLGKLERGRPLLTRPPYCAPHHSATMASLVGGGAGIARPGVISLAHCGVLFLDEAAEFSRQALDSLRQPLEAGVVTLSRVAGVATYPARFLLVIAANPCPCGRADTADAASCSCTANQLRLYRDKLSGPLRDRLDVRARLAPISRSILTAGAGGEPTAVVRARVEAARERARHRLRGTPWSSNAELPGPVLRRDWPAPAAATRQLQIDLDRGRLSNRAVDRVMKVAWTVADLAGHDRPDVNDVAAARSLRYGCDVDTLAQSA